MKVAVPLAKNILAPLGIPAATSANDPVIQKKIHCYGTPTLIISQSISSKLLKIQIFY